MPSAEVGRYCAWPTQASSYLTGCLEILRIRSHWLAARGLADVAPGDVPADEPPPGCATTPGCDVDDPTTWPPVQGPAVDPICLVGLESCGSGLANPPVRTYWEQRGSN